MNTSTQKQFSWAETLYWLISRVADFVGHFTWRPFSWLAVFLYKTFYRLDLSEFKKTKVWQYSSLFELFCREFADIDAARPINTANTVSPADGQIIEAQRLSENTQISAKGQGYTAQELVDSKESFEGYHGTTIYLSPRDYHRVHMPRDGRLIAINEKDGMLRSVKPKLTAKYPQLFAENKRTILTFEDDKSKEKFYVVLVGAMIVGKIVIQDNQHKSLPVGSVIKKGEQIGYFTFGSTVIILSKEQLGDTCDRHSSRPIKARAAF